MEIMQLAGEETVAYRLLFWPVVSEIAIEGCCLKSYCEFNSLTHFTLPRNAFYTQALSKEAQFSVDTNQNLFYN
jgi:hypothetical protein